MRHKMTFSHFSKGFIRPNLGEESGGAYLQVSGFKRQVPIHFVPLSQGDEEQSSGGGMQNGKGKGEKGKRRGENGKVKGAVDVSDTRVPTGCHLSSVLCHLSSVHPLICPPRGREFVSLRTGTSHPG